ncbi:PD-(D/E)XK nuclease family protein [Anaeromyxobacter sp. SG66]|uniref:RecB family exonuclease n=1 Tax=Anaeromyxobacter sp. SG66 TaxID=2925410 RepID=UPI001F56B8F2|nr:PD-(D/E)XK nuclease family protein [Anaeromyxobacter sp. SG66]
MPKPNMPEGLYVSVSQVKAYLLCPRKYELKYVRGAEPEFVPIALAFGSAFHEALAAYYQELKTTGEPLRRDLVLDVFRSAWDRASDGPVPLQADEEDDLAGVVDRGVSMLHAFHEHAAKSGNVEVEAVEHGFAITLHDPESGAPMEEQLVGTMDLVIREGAVRVVVEHKTAARRYTEDQLRFDVQPTAYKIAARESGIGDVALRFQVVTKTKVPVVQVADVHRDDGDEADFTRIAAGVLKAIDAGVSYPVRGWACRSCPFSSACR